MTAPFPFHFHNIEAAQFPAKPLHLAVGMFDGVHLGHQAVIETAVHSALASNGICGALTFWPHPSCLFNPEDPVQMILSPEMKVEVLKSHNVEFVIEQDFDAAFASIEAVDFIQHLKTHLPGLYSLHVGSNWRFGRKRVGDVSLLVQLGRESGVHVINVERVHYDGEAISSTRIRNYLTEGEMEQANALLAEVYFTMGKVIAGKKLGRTVGFPTLNLPWTQGLRLPFGVYCVEVEGETTVGTIILKGVANFGMRPTVEEAFEPLIEVHALEDCPFGTGDFLKIRWHRFLRPEKKFSGVEELRDQIGKDVKSAKKFWS